MPDQDLRNSERSINKKYFVILIGISVALDFILLLSKKKFYVLCFM